MDQCKNCTVRGSLAKCLKTDCSYHELWMVKEIKRVYAREVKRVLRKDGVKT